MCTSLRLFLACQQAIPQRSEKSNECADALSDCKWTSLQLSGHLGHALQTKHLYHITVHMFRLVFAWKPQYCTICHECKVYHRCIIEIAVATLEISARSKIMGSMQSPSSAGQSLTGYEIQPNKMMHGDLHVLQGCSALSLTSPPKWEPMYVPRARQA